MKVKVASYNPTNTYSTSTSEERFLKSNIALRPDKYQEGEPRLDDVSVSNVADFRIEKLDVNSWWLCCYLMNGEKIVWNLTVEEEGTILRTMELPSSQKVRYEEGSLLMDGRIAKNGYKPNSYKAITGL